MVFIVVARSLNNVIGLDNQIPWKQSEDMKLFKKITMNKTIIMGRKTYESIGKPLPNRRNIVISRQNIKIPGVEVFNSFEDAILADKDVYVIGGGEIYKKAVKIADVIYETIIDVNIGGDSFFPELNQNKWEVSFFDHRTKDEKNEYDYTFLTKLKRK